MTKSNNLTLKKMSEFIWEIEAKLHLLSWQIKGVYIWPIVRFQLYTSLLEKTGLIEKPHPHKLSKKQKLRRIPWLLYSMLMRNPLFKKQTPYVLFPTSRKILNEDIYSKQLINELGTAVCIIDTQAKYKSLPGSSSIDFFNVTLNLFMRFKAKLLNNRSFQNKTCDEIEKLIFERFHIKIELNQYVSSQLDYFIYSKALYKSLFKIKGYKQLFHICSYCNTSLIAAAKECNMKVTELQHGVITPYHLGYSYPGRPYVPYMPDELLCFGKYWYETTELPKQIQTKIIGALYVNELTNKFDNASKEKIILFTSQGTIGKPLFFLALETARLVPEYQVIFRLHPSEIVQKYQSLEPAVSSPSNFTISQVEPNTYVLMARAEYQVGVSSTTLFEGMVLGNKILLFDLPGIEYMKPVIARGDALLVRTPAELVEKMGQASAVKNYKDYYATPVKTILDYPSKETFRL
jgi:hypothetical protein